MLSVTPDVTASLSFQTAPQKAARPDPSQGTDSFGSLVDFSLPADSGNATSTAQQQQPPPPQQQQQPPAAPQQADDASASAENAPPRDNSPHRSGRKRKQCP